MGINIHKFNEVAEAAKAKTNDKRWQNAIDKAVAGVVSGWWIIKELADRVAESVIAGRCAVTNTEPGRIDSAAAIAARLFHSHKRL